MKQTKKKISKIPILDKSFKDLAWLIALHGVRNTVIENYHVAGKLNDRDMEQFNKEAVNKIYSLLQIMLNPKYREERKKLLHDKEFFPFLYSPSNWNEPVWDRDFIKVLKEVQKVK